MERALRVRWRAGSRDCKARASRSNFARRPNARSRRQRLRDAAALARRPGHERHAGHPHECVGTRLGSCDPARFCGSDPETVRPTHTPATNPRYFGNGKLMNQATSRNPDDKYAQLVAQYIASLPEKLATLERAMNA